MKETKDIVAENLVLLRKHMGLTQAELASKFNYSDKTVSKWESGESLPSIDVLKNLADFYGTTLNDMVTEKAYDKPKKVEAKKERSNKTIITLLSISVVWILATTMYVQGYLMYGVFYWKTFVWSVPISCIVALVFNSIWGKRKFAFPIITLLVWSLLASCYLQFLQYNLWIIFILGIPAQVVIMLWSTLKPRKHKHKEIIQVDDDEKTE